jgi:hypothetical protein
MLTESDLSLAGVILESYCPPLNRKFLILLERELRSYGYKAPFPPTLLPPLSSASPPSWSVVGAGDSGGNPLHVSLTLPDHNSDDPYVLNPGSDSLFLGCGLPPGYQPGSPLTGRVLGTFYLLTSVLPPLPPPSPPLPPLPPSPPSPPEPLNIHPHDDSWPGDFLWPAGFRWPSQEKVFSPWFYRLFYSETRLSNFRRLPLVSRASE